MEIKDCKENTRVVGFNEGKVIGKGVVVQENGTIWGEFFEDVFVKWDSDEVVSSTPIWTIEKE